MIIEKLCSECKEIRPISEFNKCKKNKDGLNYLCKICSRRRDVLYYRTKEGVIIASYKHQKMSSKHRGHPMPQYTRIELQEWAFSKKEFHMIYDTWTKNGYDKYSRPSFDRIDDSKGYSFDNIQIVTWKENEEKQRERVKKGLDKRSLVPVLQYSLDGELIKEHYSIAKALRFIGKPTNYRSGIVKCCQGTQKKAYGFKWKYKHE